MISYANTQNTKFSSVQVINMDMYDCDISDYIFVKDQEVIKWKENVNQYWNDSKLKPKMKL